MIDKLIGSKTLYILTLICVGVSRPYAVKQSSSNRTGKLKDCCERIKWERLKNGYT